MRERLVLQNFSLERDENAERLGQFALQAPQFRAESLQRFGRVENIEQLLGAFRRIRRREGRARPQA